MRTTASTCRCSSSRCLCSRPAGSKLHTVRERAQRREIPLALYTADMFETGNDADNRAAVRAVGTAELDLVGLAVRAPHRDADAVLRGLKRHP